MAQVCVDAMKAVKTTNDSGRTYYPVAAVNVLKAHGRSSKESQLVDGYAINCTPASQAMPKVVPDAKIALLDINLQRMRLHLGIQVLVTGID